MNNLHSHGSKTISTNEEDGDAIPYFQLNLGLSTHKAQVDTIDLLDSRANKNIILYDSWATYRKLNYLAP